MVFKWTNSSKMLQNYQKLMIHKVVIELFALKPISRFFNNNVQFQKIDQSRGSWAIPPKGTLQLSTLINYFNCWYVWQRTLRYVFGCTEYDVDLIFSYQSISDGITIDEFDADKYVHKNIEKLPLQNLNEFLV